MQNIKRCRTAKLNLPFSDKNVNNQMSLLAINVSPTIERLFLFIFACFYH
jgi:hypothetical protein